MTIAPEDERTRRSGKRAARDSASDVGAPKAPRGDGVPQPAAAGTARLAGVASWRSAARSRLRAVAGAVSPAGRAVIGVGISSWIVGWRFGWVELQVVAAACLVLLVLAVPFLLGRSSSAVELDLEPDRVTVGGRAVGRLAVRNGARGPVLPSRLELQVGAGVARFDIPALAPSTEHEELFTVPTRRRAVIPVGPARSVRGDALGLLRRVVPWPAVRELVVQPRIVNLETLGSGFLRDLEGQATNHLSSADIAFHTLRDYVPGDDRRFVHWRTSARTGRLMVRQFVDTRRSHAAIAVDLDPASYSEPAVPGDPDGDELELAIAAAASLGVRILRDEQTLVMLSGHGRMPSSTGRQVLDSSARLEASPGGGLPAAAPLLTREAAEASIVFLVTGSLASVGVMRRALRGVSPDARIIAIRARLDGRGALRESGGLTVLELGSLTGLAGLIRAAVR